MNKFIEDGPLAANWHKGILPDVETVYYDCIIILWSEDYIGLVAPHGDSLNPLRWCDQTFFPRWGIDTPEGWWTYLKIGSELRPIEVKTWKEYFGI